MWQLCPRLHRRRTGDHYQRAFADLKRNYPENRPPQADGSGSDEDDGTAAGCDDGAGDSEEG